MPRIIALVAMLLVTCSAISSIAQDGDRIRALENKVQRLEDRVARMESKAYYAGPSQQTPEARKIMRLAQARVAVDRATFGPGDIARAEELYSMAASSLSTDSSKAWLDRVVSEYPQLNRAGCAQLYRAQQETGAEKERLLKDCIERFSECYYLDGTQVGPYAIFQLAKHYQQSGKHSKADRLFEWIYDEYPNAVDHRGNLLVDGFD